NLSRAEAHAPVTLAIAALVWLGLVAAAAFAARRRAPAAIALLGLGLLPLLPVLVGPLPHVPGAAGKYPLADRWLLVSAAASSIGLGLGAARLSTRAQRIVVAALGLWGVASLVVAPAAHGFYASDQALIELEEQRFEELPPAYRTVEDRCRARDRRLVRALLAHDPDEAL